MRKLNKRKIRWIIKHWRLGELSHWQIARQQGITKQHALRVFKRFKNDKHLAFKKPGRTAEPIKPEEVQLVKQTYAQQPLGAINMEKILALQGQHIPHNRLHKILKQQGLAKTEPNKSNRRKWIRYERRHSNSLWHIDWTDHNGKPLCAILDDASRLIVGHGLFDNATAENAATVLNKAILHYGVPRQMVSDHGTQFTSLKRTNYAEPTDNKFQQKLKKLGIQHIKARIKHPQTNGKLERWFKTNEFLTKHFGSMNRAIQYYNEERPHMSLENGSLRTPMQAFMEKV